MIENVKKTVQAANKQELVSQLLDMHKKPADIQKVLRYKFKIEKILNALKMRSRFDDFLTDNEHEELAQRHEQNRDSTVLEVFQWVRGTPVEDLSYSSFELRKYAKHLPRKVLDNAVLYRFFLLRYKTSAIRTVLRPTTFAKRNGFWFSECTTQLQLDILA